MSYVNLYSWLQMRASVAHIEVSGWAVTQGYLAANEEYSDEEDDEHIPVGLSRYLGNYILTEPRVQLQPPLLTGTQRAICVLGAIGSDQQGGGSGRQGPVTVVSSKRQHARAIGLRQEEIIRKLAEADEQCRYPGQEH